MKKIPIIAMFLMSLVFTPLALAQEKPAIRIDAEKILKAVEFVKRYQALTKNPETFAAMKRLAESMKARREK